MTTKAKEHEPSEAAQKWLHGVEQFQREYAPVAEEIREMVAGMPHGTIEDSMRVVEAVIERNKRFGEEYRSKHRQHTGQ